MGESTGNLRNLTGAGSKCHWPPRVGDGEPLAALVHITRYNHKIMSRFSSVREPSWNTVLAVDAMYFQMALRARSEFQGAQSKTTQAEGRAAVVQAEMDNLNEMFDRGEIDHATLYDKFEPLAIGMDSYEYAVGAAYGDLLKPIATVHLLCVASLEAHINIRAEQLMEGRIWKSFGRLSIDAKWLFLPRLVGLVGFDPGAQPFQRFDRLIKTRNKLAHYKPRREPWTGSGAPPEFLNDLGLTVKDAERSVSAVRSMVTRLAEQLSEGKPSWLEAGESNFFEIERDQVES